MKITISLIFIIISFVLTGLVAGMVFKLLPFSIIFFFLLHTIAAAIMTAAIFILKSERAGFTKRNNLFFLFSLVFCVTVPIFGILITAFILIARGLEETKPPPILSDEITVQDASVFFKPITRSDKIEILERLDIEPFIDILKGGHSDLKRSAVKQLGNMRSQKAVQTLMIALKDKDIEIRLFAAGVLGKIEDEFAFEIKSKLVRYEKEPITNNALELVNSYLEYAESGLLDKVTSIYYYGEALHILKTLPDSENIAYLKAVSHLMLEDYENARLSINTCISFDTKNPKYNHLLLKILFEEKEFISLAEKMKQLKTENIASLNNSLVEYWT